MPPGCGRAGGGRGAGGCVDLQRTQHARLRQQWHRMTHRSWRPPQVAQRWAPPPGTATVYYTAPAGAGARARARASLAALGSHHQQSSEDC